VKLSKAEVDAIIAASPRTFVPFNKLVLSEDYQARTGGSTPKLSIAELAASIKLSGVLQNLVVVEGARGRYEVCAGGRRLEALALLVSWNDIADNYPVPVLIVPADKALIASLAENCFHVPMHPADEFAAFAKLIGQGKSVEDVAAAFGVTLLVVKRRMKLATVSPKLMAMFREDKISLDCLMVLASVDDHEKQEQAWANLPSWNRHADYLRQLLTRGEIESDRHPVAKYVTVKAYEKAGGPSRRDLFSDDDKKVYLLDAALLEKLAIEKLQRTAKQVLAEGWKWVDVRTRYVYDEYVKHGELRKAKRSSTEQEAAELERLQAQIAEHHHRMEELADQDGNEDEFYKLEQKAEALGAQADAIEAALVVWPAELMAQAGSVVYVGDNAAPAVRYGLVRPEDRSDMAQAAREAGSPEGAGGESLASLPAAKTRPVHSERLVRSLTAHRVAAIQAELLSRPDVAIAALTAQLAAKLVLDGYLRLYGSGDPLTINATDTHGTLRTEAEDMEASAAWQQLEAERQAWATLLPEDVDAILPWVLRQSNATAVRLLTFLIATSVTGVYGTEPDKQSTDGIAAALGLDMTKWWKASGPSYFNHVSKARILEVVTEAAGANAASPLQALKKDAAVSGAEQALAGVAWLPGVLRNREPLHADAASDDTGPGAIPMADDDVAVAAEAVEVA
jgi:ParB family chromosome partitioning protein